MKSSFPKLQAIYDAIESITPQCVTISKASEMIGYSERAIRHKIESGLWPENMVWKWGEDGVQLIIMKGYNTWANRQGRVSARGKHRSKSISGTTENVATRS